MDSIPGLKGHAAPATKKTTRVNKALEGHSEAKRAENAARQTQGRKTQGSHQTGARNKEIRHRILTMRTTQGSATKMQRGARGHTQAKNV